MCHHHYQPTLSNKIDNQQKVASDGSNTVVVTRDDYYLLLSFYTLPSMQRVDLIREYDYGEYFTVSIDNNTTILDFSNDCLGDGAQLIYERQDNRIRQWYMVEDSRCPPAIIIDNDKDMMESAGEAKSGAMERFISPWLAVTVIRFGGSSLPCVKYKET